MIQEQLSRLIYGANPVAKTGAASYSGYTREAMKLLGRAIRAQRIERKMTTSEVAERAGISRALLHRIERGDPKASIGAAFEAATVTGVTLFEPNVSRLATRINEVDSKLALLPSAVRVTRKAVKDDF
jgi:transcriptional regulator with XRE-family HTH domain